MAQAYQFVGEMVLKTDKAQDTLKKFVSQLKGLKLFGAEISTIFKGAGFYLMAKRFVAMSREAAKFAKEMDVVARKLGMSVDSLASMKSAFNAIGANSKGIEQVFGSIQQGMQSFKYGDGKFVSQLAAFGISAFDSSGRQKSNKSILYSIMDAAQSMRRAGRSQEDVAFMLKKLVGADYELAEKMMMGSEAFKQWQEQVNKETGVVEGRQLRNLVELNAVFSKFGETVKVLTNQFLGDIAPAVGWFVDLFQSVIREFQNIWNAIADGFHILLGNKEEWKIALDGLKYAIRVVGLVLELFIRFMNRPLKAIRRFAETIGEIIAWIVNKFKWLFGSEKKQSMEEFKQGIADDLALQVIEGKKTPEEARRISQQMGLPPPQILEDMGSTEDVVRAESYNGFIEARINAQVNIDRNGDTETKVEAAIDGGNQSETVGHVVKTAGGGKQ